VIVDLERFLAEERPYWSELESIVDWLATEPAARLDLDKTQRFHYLYERASGDLAKLTTFAAEPAVREYLESLVSRAYCQIHATRRFAGRFHPIRWFFRTFPQTFRRRVGAFWLSVAVTLAGCAFGASALLIDPEARDALVPAPFRHLLETPSERVAREESDGGERLGGRKSQFSAYLMVNNIRVSITAMALGMSWGIGTLVVLFYNGVILGMVAADYVRAGESVFLVGWLLPHGAVEIPAILLAGQAGLVLGGALIGWGSRETLGLRMRSVAPDLVTLIGGVAVLLVWAGIVEAFLSQYHEPVLPYGVKIAFGVVELVLLVLFLAFAGTRPGRERSR
jgi:uncharacterized membrane protein SpoIIM required for sporulation